MRAIPHTTVKPATRRIATVLLVALAAVTTAPQAMAAESPAGRTISDTAKTIGDATKETRKAIVDLLTPLGHTWGN
ncbi:hypothetical protein [Streptomyces termitum]|uniref:hypothetical protein n=1 Tax=Streptomyces termitum TaxID=67368 RepID=UPI0037A56478